MSISILLWKIWADGIIILEKWLLYNLTFQFSPFLFFARLRQNSLVFLYQKSPVKRDFYHSTIFSFSVMSAATSAGTVCIAPAGKEYSVLFILTLKGSCPALGIFMLWFVICASLLKILSVFPFGKLLAREIPFPCFLIVEVYISHLLFKLFSPFLVPGVYRPRILGLIVAR